MCVFHHDFRLNPWPSFTKRLKLSFFARFKASDATCQAGLRWSPGQSYADEDIVEGQSGYM